MTYLRYFFVALSSCFFFFSLQTADAKNIRLRIGNFQKIEISGKDLIFNRKHQYHGQRTIKLICKDHSIHYRNGSRVFDTIHFSNKTNFIQLNKQSYRKKISLIPQANSCLVINTLELEKYLYGLINREMYSHWPMEALKAQAVAARSYALSIIKKRKSYPFDLEINVKDQVYGGVSSESLRAKSAVRQTKGVSLLAGKKILKAFYHANCSGLTEHPNEVWGYSPQSRYYKRVHCPAHLRKENIHHWSYKINRSQLNGVMAKYFNTKNLKKLTKIASVTSFRSAQEFRPKSVQIMDNKGSSLQISSHRLREIVGNTKIKSTNFRISQKNNWLHFHGEGNGHAVGMCQYGAKEFALSGKNFIQILNHYYPLAKIRKIY